MFSQFLRGRELDHLIQGISDHRAGKTGGNILYGSAFLLSLFHVGVHKHRAPCSEVNRMRCKKCFLCEFFGRITQRLSKVLNKRAAAGRTCFIEQDIVYRSVFQPDTFHVLPADIQHAVYLGIKKGRSGTVRNGFHLALVKPESGLQQAFSVTGRAGSHNLCFLRQLFLQFCCCPHRRMNRRTLIAVIPGKKKFSVFPDQRKLRGC